MIEEAKKAGLRIYPKHKVQVHPNADGFMHDSRKGFPNSLYVKKVREWVDKVVFASSSAVYGDTTSLPIGEDTPLNPLSPYAINKAAGEMYCRVFTEAYGLSTISLRYFNVFGPRQDPNSPYAAAIPNFISAILRGESPMIYGDGEQSRDFVPVQEVVKANILACQSPETGEFNVGLGRKTTINQLIDIIQKVMGHEIEARYTDPRPGDVKHSFADISRAKSFIG